MRAPVKIPDNAFGVSGMTVAAYSTGSGMMSAPGIGLFLPPTFIERGPGNAS